jgi:hypothetical protein
MNNDELVALVRQELDASMGYDADILATKREQALNYYHGIVESAPEGRSNVVSFDVADTVHALLSQISPIFQSSTLEFPPTSEEDEQQAQLESDFVRWQLEQSDGYKILSEAAHDALLIGNGWIKVEIEEETTVTEERYHRVEPVQLQKLMMPNAENQEVDVKESDDGYTIRRSTTTRELKADCISPDVMLFSTARDQFDFQELRFVGERKLYSGNDLKAMGLTEQEIKSIPEHQDDDWPAVRAREGIYQDETDNEPTYQDAETLRQCYDVYYRVDLNNNGSSELRHIMIGGSVLILNEPADCIPYATGSPVPMPHRIQGTGMFELMKQVQDSKTHILRQYMDNLAVMNASRLGVVEGQANMDDLTNGRINGIIRMRSPDAIVPMPSADIGQQAVNGLNYQDTIRSNRGGAAVELGEADRQLMQSSATAAGAAVESSEKMAGWYCHNMVNTLLKNTYLLIHRKLRLEMDRQMSAKIGGKWATTNPSEWQERKSMKITAGLTSTERNNKSAAVMLLMQQQAQAMQAGADGVLVDFKGIFNATSDWIRLQDIGNPEEYLVDPDSEEAQQAQQSKAEQAQQQQAQQQRMVEQQIAIEQGKIAQDRYKVDQEIAWKYYNTNMDAQVSEADITSKAVLETEKINASERQAEDSRFDRASNE